MEQMQLKGKWENLDGAFNESIKSVEFGISRVDSEFNDVRMEEINNATPVLQQVLQFSQAVSNGFYESIW